MTQTRKPHAFLIFAYVAFFASGAASLIAEVTWNRMLIVVVGNSLSAAAMIVVIFMGGLGLGSYVGGRWFARRGDTLVPYALMELVIGTSVLLSPGLFDLLTGFFTAAAGRVDARTAIDVSRIAVTMLALLGPAFLMGATFPAIISGVRSRSLTQRSARTGYLYSINTLGAATGTYVAGFHLLLEFGVHFTLNVAFGLYLLAALCALAAHRLQAAAGSPTAPDPEIPSMAAPSRGRRRFLLLATFGIGFVALGYQILLTRLAILYLGNNVSVFALVLTAFLLGTGVSAVAGTWFYGLLEGRSGTGHRLFGGMALAAGILLIAIPYLMLSNWIPGIEHLAREAALARHNPLPVLLLLIVPTMAIGALLPLAIRMLAREGAGESTHESATLYAVNTAGGILGAALANHVLVPAIGIQATLLLLTTICFLVAAFNPGAEGFQLRRSGLAVIGLLVLVVAIGVGLPGLMDLYANQLAASTGAEKTRIHLVHAGRAATVTVLDQIDPRQGSYRDMYLNGVEEASTRYWHVQLFKLLGMLPVAMHEGKEGKDALVIAFGAGITAGSALASGDVASLDVVDLNPDIERINDLFTRVNGDVFNNPRFTFHNDDGRNYLVTTNKQYDLIIGDSTHPCAYDSWILYTEEFYRTAKKRLKPGGIIAQWVPILGPMQGQLLNIHLNTVRKVFPNVTFWMVYGSDQAFFMATPEPFTLDRERLQAKLDALPDWFQAEEYHMDTVERVAGYFWLDEAAMDRMAAGETRINTDDRHYFVQQAAVWPLPPQRQLPAFQAGVLPYFGSVEPAFAEAVNLEQSIAQLTTRAVFFQSSEDLFEAYCLDPTNGNTRYQLSLVFAGMLPEPEGFCLDREIEKSRELVAMHPDNPLALNTLADLLGQAGQLDEGLALASRAAELDPGNGMILDTLGWIRHRRGENEDARVILREAERSLPGHPIVLYHLAVVGNALGEREEARILLEKALASPTTFPERAEAEALLASLR